MNTELDPVQSVYSIALSFSLHSPSSSSLLNYKAKPMSYNLIPVQYRLSAKRVYITPHSHLLHPRLLHAGQRPSRCLSLNQYSGQSLPGVLERREKGHDSVIWVMCLQRLQHVSTSVHMSEAERAWCVVWSWRLTCLLVEVSKGSGGEGGGGR